MIHAGDVFLFIRMLMYPFMSYALVTMAFSGQNGQRSRRFTLYISLAMVFLVLFVATVLRILHADTYLVFDWLNYAMTPILFTASFLAWRNLVHKARKEKEHAKNGYCNNTTVSISG